uniref:hypothetical protein n=1 Tax=Streptomyces polyasparticus TaxID=2767826 RepID=UPI001F31077E|nr:hypothetical protein [Streptomyces polyasparticus]
MTAMGRGSYARTTPERFGFPRLHRTRGKRLHGFISGDLVRAEVPKGKWAGTRTGVVAVRARGQHRVTTAQGRFDISYKHPSLLQRADGHSYAIVCEPGMQTARKTG